MTVPGVRIPHSPQSIDTQLVAKRPAVFVTRPSRACSRKEAKRKQPDGPQGRQLCINALQGPPRRAVRECTARQGEHNPDRLRRHLRYHQADKALRQAAGPVRVQRVQVAGGTAEGIIKERHPNLDAAHNFELILSSFCELLCIWQEGFFVELEVFHNLRVHQTEFQDPVHSGATQEDDVGSQDGGITTRLCGCFPKTGASPTTISS